MQTTSQRRQDDSIVRQIAALHEMSHEELKTLWRTLNGSDPPAYNRAFIIKRLAYRIQEIHYGGLSEQARETMRRMVRENGLDRKADGSRSLKQTGTRRSHNIPVVGTRFIREWNGRTCEVTVVHGGFEFEGIVYRSLTAVAKAITGTQWNGPVFFGIKDTNTSSTRKKH